MSKLRDDRRGAYDPVNQAGKPQPDQVLDNAKAHEDAQWGADVRPDPVQSDEDVLPEGLRRPRIGPDHKAVE